MLSLTIKDIVMAGKDSLPVDDVMQAKTVRADDEARASPPPTHPPGKSSD